LKVRQIPDPMDPSSDAGLALWLADRLRNQLVWVGGLGWLKRAGHVWVPEPQALTVVSDHLRARIPDLANAGVNPRRVAGVESSAVAAAVERLLRGRLAEDGTFDADPYALNCPNGVVALRTGELRDHDPLDRFLRSTAMHYLPGHSSELWDAALQSLPPEVLDWLQVRLGHAVTACPPWDDRMLLLIGSGDNGKSTLIDGMVAALGGYASTVSERVLTARQGDHPTELMDLMDLRVAVLEELPGAAT
jgi:phage/plasmid-associated DNA primase